MTKEQAQRDTVKKFTNLMDGKVLPFVSVATIINYYEGRINSFKADCGIKKNFEEEWIKELEDEAADY